MVAVHNFLCTYRTLCLYLCSTVQPKIYEFYSTLIHRAGVVGNFVQFHAEFVYTFQIFVSSNFCGSKFGEFFRLILRMMSLEIGVKRKHKVSSLAGQAGENFQSNKQLIQADVFKPEFEGLQFFCSFFHLKQVSLQSLHYSLAFKCRRRKAFYCVCNS